MTIYFKSMCEAGGFYTEKEKKVPEEHFVAGTISTMRSRLLIGTLRESNLLDDTIIVFTSDHGDMLFNHEMVAKRAFFLRKRPAFR